MAAFPPGATKQLTASGAVWGTWWYAGMAVAVGAAVRLARWLNRRQQESAQGNSAAQNDSAEDID
jgi:hypothetical protein